MTLDSLSERMAEAARELQDQHDPRATLERATWLAVHNISGADAVGITIVHRDRSISTEAHTDEMAAKSDQLQYDAGEGPCLDATWQQATVYSPSLAYDRRWPVWGPRAVEETGAQSVLSFQLFTTGDVLGALNLYSRTRGGFDDIDQEEGLALAAHIAIALATAKEIEELGQAIDSRTVIGQATGIIMERFSIDSVQAFALMTRLSSTSNLKLRELALDVVESRRLPGGPTPGAADRLDPPRP